MYLVKVENNVVTNVIVGTVNNISRSNSWKVSDTIVGVGDTFDVDNNVFYSPQPYPSWSLDNTFIWQPPVSYPSEATVADRYIWNEATTNWVASK
jgi:hypothetical protein